MGASQWDGFQVSQWVPRVPFPAPRVSDGLTDLGEDAPQWLPSGP